MKAMAGLRFEAPPQTLVLESPWEPAICALLIVIRLD
jgi:hypothetical protein